MLESQYQSYLKNKLEEMFPGCVILPGDPLHIQGIPDLIILYHTRWAALEVKISEDADVRPNQPYYVDLFNNMSFAAFIYPENEEHVLDGLQQAFDFDGTARIPWGEQLPLDKLY